MCGAIDWPELVFGFVTWGYIFWKFCPNELNIFLLNCIPNSWYKQAYVQGFDCEYISFDKPVNIFYQMDISESINEGVVEPSH